MGNAASVSPESLLVAASFDCFGIGSCPTDTSGVRDKDLQRQFRSLRIANQDADIAAARVARRLENYRATSLRAGKA